MLLCYRPFINKIQLCVGGNIKFVSNKFQAFFKQEPLKCGHYKVQKGFTQIQND